MLTDLLVEDLGVIDRAEVSFEPGCAALTGETGAGKTLLVTALGLLLGERSDRTTVRTGAAEARVEGRYSVPPDHPAVALLRDHGVIDGTDGPSGDIELVIGRTVAAEGRAGRARVNGRLVTAALLAEVGQSLTEVAGQHEHHRIGAPAWQRGHLDQWAGPEAVALASRVRDAVREADTWARRHEELESGERERARALDLLDYEIGEIAAASIEPGEGARLARDAARLDRAESIATVIASAVSSITGEGAAQDLLSAAAAEVAGLARDDPELAALAARLEASSVEVADVAEELARISIPADSNALEEIHQRLSVLGRLQRKYGADEDEILRYLEDARARAAELRALDEGVEEARLRAGAARRRAEELATELSGVRRAAGPRLTKEVEARLESLALPETVFEIAFEPCAVNEGGAETVEYLVSFNPGEAARPIRKVASGGELSRLALALNLVSAHGDASTIVFDEVDADVGGEAARSVGAALAELTETSGRQVMVVTHLPQVAAFADAQYRIEKAVVAGRASATVARVDGTERVAELSRMLAGMPASDRARGHAEELLEHAARRRAERGRLEGSAATA